MTREISFEVEVPGTPEEVWDAIGTARGISGWFTQAEIAGDRMIQHHGNGYDMASRIVASDAPRRFAYQEEFRPAEDAPSSLVATEFLVEARSGGSCVVRVVQSGFGAGAAWERAIESFTSGWPAALDDLRIYLTHFAGEPVAGFSTGRPLDGPWEPVRDALGLPADPAPGDRVVAPHFEGTITRVGDGGFVSLLLDAPGRGIGFLGAGGPGDQVFLFVRAKLFGDDAPLAAANEAAWEEWLSSAPAAALRGA
jgi:uncharacterized protein YndB with AHSA1/START domain